MITNDTTSEATYRCLADEDIQCAETCTSLASCQYDCHCVVLSTQDNDHADRIMPDWFFDVLDVFFCILPILFLIYVTTKSKNPMPTTKSLPISAALMYAIRLMYLEHDVLLTTASVIRGLHEAFTPLCIMAGAITLFETMERTMCLQYMMEQIQSLTAGHTVATLMLINAFMFMVEGASGFGTPVALAAPMLVSSLTTTSTTTATTTEQPPANTMDCIVVLLIFNTFATVWGAVGTPIWFGFGSLDGLSEDEYIDISQKAAVALGIAGLIVIPMVFTILVPWRHVKQNMMFIYYSLFVTIGPTVIIATMNYEFSSLLGGIIGCILISLGTSYEIGLYPMTNGDQSTTVGRSTMDVFIEEDIDGKRTTSDHTTRSREANLQEQKEEENSNDDIETGNETSSKDEGGDVDSIKGRASTAPEGDSVHAKSNQIMEVLSRTFPIWGVVVMLVLTRVEQIGLKEKLTSKHPYFEISLGTWGDFRISSSGVLQLNNILTYPGMNWKYEIFYIPFLVPFVVVSVLTMILYRRDMSCSPGQIATNVINRLKNPAIALLGALVLVQLMIRVDEVAPAYILGTVLAKWFKEAFVVICPLLGALGSFFSGSTTVSNLTFGDIQLIAAESIGVSRTSMLALQAVGASAGNGICLNNIIAACAVVGLNINEGKILMQTYKYVFCTTTIATIVMLIFFFQF